MAEIIIVGAHKVGMEPIQNVDIADVDTALAMAKNLWIDYFIVCEHEQNKIEWGDPIYTVEAFDVTGCESTALEAVSDGRAPITKIDLYLN